ncbi:uncharacterized protein LTR77_006445 [Saxophila tyrrhenica]|uniref:Uncharacterized protein n=1 Tax=Saxophila tyrrhenica TaxID=1690608 RepID=A0AAV9P850_9PEZI|nr:hypothetical protein LTR77_006445 [Saxophila tyrrhenica]
MLFLSTEKAKMYTCGWTVNCSARKRECQYQAEVGRAETNTITSRERIAQLESTTSSLWRAVSRIQSELGHVQDSTLDDIASTARHDTESEDSDTTPIAPPTHLQQLFDNEYVDTRANGGSAATGSNYERASSALVVKARSRLQHLIPSKADITALCAPSLSPSLEWISIYAALFPTINMFNTAEDMITQHDELSTAGADPITIAGLLSTTAIILLHRPADAAPVPGIENPTSWIKHVNDAVEQVVIKEDDLVCSVEGIETTLLFARL